MVYQKPIRLTEKQAAEYLGLASSQTLQNWRGAGKAPPFYKIGGKVIYDLGELRTWMEQRRIAASSVPTGSKELEPLTA